MKQFQSIFGPEVLEIGRLEEPGAYIQMGTTDARVTIWLSPSNCVRLAETLLRIQRKNGNKA